mmetsp:Transcript_6878/g.22225  ORF Transcript_6878/g.22225 Transcript_6878/m.22225 type:complete len:269 (-) Transcript_6878:286-1092(-)
MVCRLSCVLLFLLDVSLGLVPTLRRDGVRMVQGVPRVPYRDPGWPEHYYSNWMDIYQRLHRDRVLLISNFLDEDQANRMIAILLYLQRESSRDPISIYMNIPGALMKSTLAVYDTIKSLDCPVSTINLGLSTGMAAFLCGAGTKGQRYALPNARFLVQRTGLDDPYEGSAEDVKLIVVENKRDNDRMEKAFAEMTGQPLDKIQSDMKRDFYLSADEAKAYGLVDHVLQPRVKEPPKYFFAPDIGFSPDDVIVPPGQRGPKTIPNPLDL